MKKNVSDDFFNKTKRNLYWKQENYQYYYDNEKDEIIYLADKDRDKAPGKGA